MGVKINTKSINIYKEIVLVNNKEEPIGKLKSAAFSPKFNKVVGLAMIEKNFYKIPQKFSLNLNGNKISGEICNLPIL